MEIAVEETSQTLSNQEVNIDIPERLLQIVHGEPRENHNLGSKMQKVPPLLRLDKINQQDYDPLVVSLGPYHHGKKELQLAENFKLTALKTFVADIGRDAMFVYSQIPFWLLKSLMCLGYGEQKGEEMLNDFLSTTVFGEYKGRGITSNNGERPLHLLDAFWLVLVSNSPKDEPTTPKPKSGNGSGCLSHFTDIGKCSNLHKSISDLPCSLRKRRNEKDCNQKKYVHSFRSPMDLKAKGIHFRPSSADSLKGINFKSGYFYATLEVPIWFVSTYTKGFFLNMIAFEMCPSTSTNRAVTAYIEFMKSLIDNPKDVKELREKRILLTTLGSDEEVVKAYKEINTYGVNDVAIFHDVEEQIQAHYNNKAKTWLAELFYTYFRSPWAAIALFAAAFLLVLTFLQTYYTVMPS